MTTLSITIEDKLAQWLQARSAEVGQSPEELVHDTLRRRQRLDAFQALADRLHQNSVDAGITREEEIIQEVLAERELRRGS